ncbi:MAG: hypothetical protein R3330_16980, partial [Saprospiraceae bacterium]|nr:hypothetical protein [Saprospiraceae bacterium]
KLSPIILTRIFLPSVLRCIDRALSVIGLFPYVVRLEIISRRTMPRFFARLITLVTVFTAGSDLFANESEATSSGWTIAHWSFMASVYTRHFDPDPDHDNDQHLISAEAGFNNHWLLGAAVFDNSYGQDSQFVYIGKRWQFMQSEFWYLKVRGGLLHGYKEPYEDKIPLNGLGIAPAIIPSLGFQYGHFISEISIAGTAAGMLTIGIQF